MENLHKQKWSGTKSEAKKLKKEKWMEWEREKENDWIRHIKYLFKYLWNLWHGMWQHTQTMWFGGTVVNVFHELLIEIWPNVLSHFMSTDKMDIERCEQIADTLTICDNGICWMQSKCVEKKSSTNGSVESIVAYSQIGVCPFLPTMKSLSHQIECLLF